MTTLTEKLDAIELLMINQHIEVIQALEAITLALGGTPPTGATLADVIIAITAQTTVLSDVHLDTISMDQKLLLIRDNVAGILTKANDATTLIGLINDDVSDVQMTIGLKAAGPENTLAFLTKANNMALQNLVTSTGLLASPDEGTILELLGDLRAIQADCCGDKGPKLAECDDAFKSGGLVTLPWALIGGTSQTFAVFDGILPAGLTYGTVFGLGADETELVAADWGQWWVFVQSDQAQYSDGADGFTRYPTNEWRLMSGSGSRAFAVDARGALIVTLCPIADYNPGGINPDGLPDAEGFYCVEALFPTSAQTRFVINGTSGYMAVIGGSPYLDLYFQADIGAPVTRIGLIFSSTPDERFYAFTAAGIYLANGAGETVTIKVCSALAPPHDFLSTPY